MPKSVLSRDTKELLMRMVDNGQITVAMIPGMVPTTASTTAKLRREWLRNGRQLASPDPDMVRGRPKEIPPIVEEAVVAMVMDNPAIYLEEIKEYLILMGLDAISISTIRRILKNGNLRRKSASVISKQQCPVKRAEFQTRIGQYNPEQLVFVDESGFDLRVTDRKLVWGLPGHRVWQRVNYNKRGKHYTLLPACSLSKPLFATKVFENGCDGLDFFNWVVDNVLPEMNPFPGERSVLVADNASIHKFPELRQMVELCGEL